MNYIYVDVEHKIKKAIFRFQGSPLPRNLKTTLTLVYICTLLKTIRKLSVFSNCRRMAGCFIEGILASLIKE
jgi:hypothetical protein